MKEEKLWLALSMVDDRHLNAKDAMAKKALPMNSKHNRSNRRFEKTLLLAAILTCLLGTVAFAAYSIHQQRQKQLRRDLSIDQNQVQSYEEYAVPEEAQPGVILLSAIRDVDFQKVYLNVSPVEREEIDTFPEDWNYYFSVDGGETFGSAMPFFDPAEYDGSGFPGMRRAIDRSAYDEENKILIMECPIPLTELETCVIRFEPFTITEPESGVAVTIHALELNPTSATWHLSYEGSPNSLAEDYIGNNAVLRFADGTEMKTGGPVASGYSDGRAYPKGLWVKAVDIHALVGVSIDGRELTIIG